MTTPNVPDTTERDLGRLEGRVEEQGTRMDQLHADMTAGFLTRPTPAWTPVFSRSTVNARMD